MPSAVNDNIMNELDPDTNFLDMVLPENFCKYSTVSEFNNDFDNNYNEFSLINYNICSFHQNGAQFESLLDAIKKKFKCIVMSETWNNEAITTKL